MSQPSILQRVAAGDSAAVSECLEAYGRLVWAIARRLLRSQTEAEDAVQEAFIAVWKNAHRYDPAIAAEPTFVAMIARRRLIDRRRKLERLPATSVTIDESAAPTISASCPVEIRDEAERVAACLQELKREERLVIELAIRDGLSQSEIASQIDMPLGTVKSHARRGMKRLRELLAAA